MTDGFNQVAGISSKKAHWSLYAICNCDFTNPNIGNIGKTPGIPKAFKPEGK